MPTDAYMPTDAGSEEHAYGCSSEPGGEIGVTGWWQQIVNATGWLMHFLKEISTEI